MTPSNRTERRIFFWTLVLAAVFLSFICPRIARCQTCVSNSQVTLTGNLRGANGISSSNYVMTMAPSQQGYIAGCGVNIQTTFACGTSTDGSVVGVPNPLTATINTTSGSGSLPAGVYYSVYEFYDAAGDVTLPSPETRLTLSVTESLVVNPPTSGIPSNAVGMSVFIGTSSGGETLQGQTTGTASFVQSTTLTTGASPSTTNTTLCKITANDAVWPVGTGYNVSLVDSQGNPVPGYPMQWQLLGPGTTYNLSNGLPYYHGVVLYPVPILAQPANHGTQSISGSLNMGGYNLLNVGKVGIGTATPGWSLDVENGLGNFNGGFILGGVAPVGTECAGSTDGIAIDTYFPCSSGAPFYQTVDQNGTPLTQRYVLNFSPQFAATDSTSPAQTNVDLGLSGVTAGTYANPGITVDQYGRITAVTPGGTTLGSINAVVDDTCPGGNCGGYFPTAGGVFFQGSISGTGWPSPAIATLSDFYVQVDDSPTGLGITSLQFTVYQNGSPTSVTCTMTTTAQSCNDTTHTITAAAGDLFSTQVIAVGTTSSTVHILTSLL